MNTPTAVVVVKFRYEPDEPDPGNSTGMSEGEYDRLMDQLGSLGAFDIEVGTSGE